MVKVLTIDSFKEKVSDLEGNDLNFKGDKPALIKFGAEWCMPCKMVAPVIEELSDDYAGKIDIYEIDTEESPELASVFGIQSIPALLFIPLDEQPKMLNGAIPKEEFVKQFDDIFGIK